MPQAVQGAEGPAVQTTQYRSRFHRMNLQDASLDPVCRIFFAPMAPGCIAASSFQCNFKLWYNLAC